jgi:cation transport protein ChaC
MAQRRMRLTEQLVSRVPAWRADEAIGAMPPGSRLANDADHDAVVRGLLADAPAADVWVFAYGSLIWNPGFEFVEQRGAIARGWHRSFCLGWDLWFRGCLARPGLMLVLDRGGSCSGIAFRLPPERVEAALGALSRREIHIVPHPFPARWISVTIDGRPMRAIAFAIDRNAPEYLTRRSPDEIAAVLATAAGRVGSMADYLFQTVSRLEAMGLRDRHLWQLQELVARRLEAGQAS